MLCSWQKLGRMIVSLRKWAAMAMPMRGLKNNSRVKRHRASGFSLLEMLTVVAISIIMVAVTFVGMVPIMKQQRVTNAYNLTLEAMRQARDNAIAQRTSYSVTFSSSTSPNSITVAPTLTAGAFQGQQNSVTYQLPSDVSFYAASAISSTAPPDNYGSGAHAIDFGYTPSGGAGGATTIYFCPDGSSQIALSCAGAGNWGGGVVYMSRTGDLMSSRAISLWGATGRIHGWRLYPIGSGSTYKWLRQ